MISVTSITSGQQLTARIIKTSKFRKFIGLPWIKLAVMSSDLKGKKERMGWYGEKDISSSYDKK